MSQDYFLVVVHPFGSYAKGQRIIDADEVSLILNGPNHTSVVKILAPVSPPPEHAD